MTQPLSRTTIPVAAKPSLLAVAVVLLLLGACSGPRLDRTPATLLAEGKMPPNVADALRRIDDDTLSAQTRRNAAQALLNMEGREARQARVATLAPNTDPSTWRAMIQATLLSAQSEDPSPDLVTPMLTLLGRTDGTLTDELAKSLGRYDSSDVYKRLVRIAEDKAINPNRRGHAMLALGYQRTPEAAEVLIDFTDPANLEEVRAPAFDALIAMTGLKEYHHDYSAWQDWWERNGKLKRDQWQDRLVEGFDVRETTDNVQAEERDQRLVDFVRDSYFNAAERDQQPVLVSLMTDDILLIRQEAMELADIRLQQGQKFGEPLRAAMRARLIQDTPDIRERATRLLRDLVDEPAADLVARRLAQKEESVAAVKKAHLLLLARLPRVEAVQPALELLNEPATTNEAAAALAAAAEAGMMNNRDLDRAARSLRRLLKGVDEPAPPMIDLLGRVGSADDWQRIEQWIASRNPTVKAAAARAWAESGRPLVPLVDRMNDPVIQPILLSAAKQHGRDPEVFRKLTQTRPDNSGGARHAWREALTAMSGRVPPENLLDGVMSVQGLGEGPAQVEAMLSSGLDAKREIALSDRQRAMLLLERGMARLRNDDATRALIDFDGTLALSDEIPIRSRERTQRGKIETLLRLDDQDSAIETLKQLVGPPDAGGVRSPTDDPVIGSVLNHADRLAVDNRGRESLQLLEDLRVILGPAMRPDIASQINIIESKIKGSIPDPGTAVEVDDLLPDS